MQTIFPTCSGLSIREASQRIEHGAVAAAGVLR